MRGRVLSQKPRWRKRLRGRARVNLVVGKGPATQPQPQNQPSPQNLGVSLSGGGSGSVTSNPAGISCGSTCSHSYAYGTTVTLTATPASGSVFSGWSGACTGSSNSCSVTMIKAQSITAGFVSSGPWRNAVNDNFSGLTSLPSHWCTYNGHDKVNGGNYLPSHVYVSGGYLHLLSSYMSSGPAGAAWYQGAIALTRTSGGGCGGSSKYPLSAVDSRLTVRMRVLETGNGKAAGHRNILRWPDGGGWPSAGEEDMWEGEVSLTSGVSAFFHYGSTNRQIIWPYPPRDMTQWHTYRFQRLNDVISIYIDDMTTPVHVYNGNSTTLPETFKHWIFQQQCSHNGCPAPSTDTEDWQIASIAIDNA